jgi:hypothetical protein
MNSLNTTTCLNSESIKFYGAGLQTIKNDQIDVNVSYSWSRLIKEMPAGYWVSGIAISREIGHTAVSSFLPTQKELTNSEILANCFSILPGDIKKSNEILGFATIEFENS